MKFPTNLGTTYRKGKKVYDRYKTNPVVKKATAYARKRISQHPLARDMSRLLYGIGSGSSVVFPFSGAIRKSTPPIVKVNQGTGSGITKTFYSSKGSKVSVAERTLMETSQPLSTKFTSSGQVNSTSQRQAVYSINTVNSTHLRSTASSGFTKSETEVKNDTTQLSGYTTVGKSYLKDVRSVLRFSNTTAYNITVKILEVVPKYDTTDTSLNDPLSAWDAGTLQNSELSFRLFSDNIDAYPTNSDYFNAYYAIDSVYSISLAAGGSHIHTSLYSYNMTIDNLRITDAFNILSGISRFKLLIVTGSPVHDSDSVIGTINVGMGPSSIDFVETTFYKMHNTPSRRAVTQDFSSFVPILNPNAVTDDDYTESAPFSEFPST